jgi:hypothetical protein
MLAKPSNVAEGDRVTKTDIPAPGGWRNSMDEAYTGNHAGHRAVRTRLKVDTAP